MNTPDPIDISRSSPDPLPGLGVFAHPVAPLPPLARIVAEARRAEPGACRVQACPSCRALTDPPASVTDFYFCKRCGTRWH